MMKPFIKYSLALSLILQGPFLWAQTSTTNSTGVESTGSTQNGASVKDGADQTASANKSAQVQQYLMGAMMFTMSAQQYSQCNSHNWYPCVLAAIYAGLGGMSIAQGNEHGSVAKSAAFTGYQSDGLGSNPYDYGSIDLNDAALKNDANIKALGSNIKQLEQAGLYNSKTGKITTPDGKSYKVSDFASQSSMTAAGIPNGAALGALEAYKKVQAKAADKAGKLKLGALTTAGGFDEGGGGAKGGASGAGDAVGAGGYAGSGAGGAALDRDPSSLAGMQKNYNGEPIGVAADSIFLMMTRRYKVKESQESFYTE